ncbi:MAG TPA: DUF2589 domain-containing protein [Myxococcaceae bacterium]|nr:DUF2589 domain-containing protein [Myxococcaceae bacterium]
MTDKNAMTTGSNGGGPLDRKTNVEAAEFQEVPLHVILGAPLAAVIKAQEASAESTGRFVERFAKQAVDFTYEHKDGNSTEAVRITAPLLSIIPVPNLLIDSLTVNFKYEISQTAVEKKKEDTNVQGSAKLGAMLAPWVDASFSGGVTTSSSLENTAHRGGSLDVTMRASQAPVPAALDKLLQLLSSQLRVNGKKVEDGTPPASGSTT